MFQYALKILCTHGQECCTGFPLVNFKLEKKVAKMKLSNIEQIEQVLVLNLSN